MKGELEERVAPLTGVEVRKGEADNTVVFEGHAAVFNQESVIRSSKGAFREKILPGAFKRSLGMGADVRYLINHEGMPLARTKSGTLSLSEDDHGLKVRAELDATNPLVQSLRSAVTRGDMDGMSFAFWTTEGGDEWNHEPDDGGLPTRALREVSIHDGDVSSVAYPAYEGASGAIRSMQTPEEVRGVLEARGVHLEEDTTDPESGPAPLATQTTTRPELLRMRLAVAQTRALQLGVSLTA